jgi:uncharacterized protein (TIGR03435 family)
MNKERGTTAKFRKRLVTALGVAAVAGLGVLQMANAQLIRAKDGVPLPAFDVASVKPNNSGSRSTSVWSRDARFSVENLSLLQIVKIAFGTKSDAQVTGGPAEILRSRYDIEAKIDEEQFTKMKALSSEDRRLQIDLMLQALLADRFHLEVKFETKELPVYALVLAKGGPKFHPAVTASGHPNLNSHSDAKKVEASGSEDNALDGLTRLLSAQSEVGDRLVINKTGLSGKYDWSLHWTRENNDAVAPGGGASQAAVDTEGSGPQLFTALEEQLGLKLKPEKDEVETIVINRLEPLTAN